MGSYRTPEGGIGLGYRLGALVLRTGGNGWFYPVLVGSAFRADDGYAYAQALSHLGLPPGYFDSPSKKVRRETKQLFVA